MRKRTERARRSVLASLLVWALAIPAYGQAVRGQRPAGRAAQPAAEGVTPAEIQQMFDALFLVRAQEVLQLREDQYPRFLTRLRALQAIQRRAENQRRQALNQLRRLLQNDARPDEAAIKERLKALEDLAAGVAAETKQAQASLDEVLDVRQQARFRLLEEEMERRKLDLLARTRQANRPQANRPRPE
jgi:hypothetical protein